MAPSATAGISGARRRRSSDEQEHPGGPILNAINPPPWAADAPYSGFGFARDLAERPHSARTGTSLWSNFSGGTASIPARVAVNAVDPHAPDTMCSSGTSRYRNESGTARSAAYVANKANKIYTSENINVPGDFSSLYVLGTAALIRPGFSSITWRGRKARDSITRSRRGSNGGSGRRKSSLLIRGDTLSATPNTGKARSGSAKAVHCLSNRQLDKSSTTFDIRQRLGAAVVRCAVIERPDAARRKRYLAAGRPTSFSRLRGPR